MNTIPNKKKYSNTLMNTTKKYLHPMICDNIMLW